MVPLISLLEMKETINHKINYRDNSEDTNYIISELDKRSIVYVTIDLIKELLKYNNH